MTAAFVDDDRGAAVRHAQRAAGQVAGLASMIAEGRRFGDVVQQLLAARGSLDALLVRLVELQLRGADLSSGPRLRSRSGRPLSRERTSG